MYVGRLAVCIVLTGVLTTACGDADRREALGVLRLYVVALVPLDETAVCHLLSGVSPGDGLSSEDSLAVIPLDAILTGEVDTDVDLPSLVIPLPPGNHELQVSCFNSLDEVVAEGGSSVTVRANESVVAVISLSDLTGLRGQAAVDVSLWAHTLPNRELLRAVPAFSEASEPQRLSAWFELGSLADVEVLDHTLAAEPVLEFDRDQEFDRVEVSWVWESAQDPPWHVALAMVDDLGAGWVVRATLTPESMDAGGVGRVAANYDGIVRVSGRFGDDRGRWLILEAVGARAIALADLNADGRFQGDPERMEVQGLLVASALTPEGFPDQDLDGHDDVAYAFIDTIGDGAIDTRVTINRDAPVTSRTYVPAQPPRP